MEQIQKKYGPWALITGASSGLGAEFAKQLAKKGFSLVLVARRQDRLDRIARNLEKEYLVKTKTLSLDLADIQSVTKIMEETEDLDIGLVVNNAGYSITGELISSNIQNHMDMMHVNCISPFLLSVNFSNRFNSKGRQGGIIIVSSTVAFIPTPNWTHYSATKAYSLFIGEGLSSELAKKGIDVLTLCPGGMKTEFQKVAKIKNTGAMEVGPVVTYALKSLGKKSVAIPGWHNKLFFYYLPKVFPRRLMNSILGNLITKLTVK